MTLSWFWSAKIRITATKATITLIPTGFIFDLCEPSRAMVAEATACRWQWAPSVLPSELQQRAATTAIPLIAIQPTDTLPAILTSKRASG